MPEGNQEHPRRQQGRRRRAGSVYRAGAELDQLRQETADELGLQDELAQGPGVQAEDAGRVGGRMTRRLVQEAKEQRRKRAGQKERS